MTYLHIGRGLLAKVISIPFAAPFWETLGSWFIWQTNITTKPKNLPNTNKQVISD